MGKQSPVFSYSRVSDPGIRKSFQTFFFNVCKVFKSDFDGKNRFCSNTAYQLKCPVEMVFLAHSGFLGISRIRYINQIGTTSRLIFQYIFKASVLDLAGKLKVDVAYINDEINFFCEVFVLSEVSWKLHTGEFLMDSNSTSPMFSIETLMKRTKYVVTEKNCFNYHVWSLLAAILRNCGFSKIWCRMGNGSFFKWILFLKWKHFIGEFDRWTQASSDAEIGVRLMIRNKKPSPFLGNWDSQAFVITIRKQIFLTNPLLGFFLDEVFVGRSGSGTSNKFDRSCQKSRKIALECNSSVAWKNRSSIKGAIFLLHKC